MNLYANLRADSKYQSQRQPIPFKVYFEHDPAGYHVKGNGNQYRVTDVNLFVKTSSGEYKNISPQLKRSPESAVHDLIPLLKNAVKRFEDHN